MAISVHMAKRNQHKTEGLWRDWKKVSKRSGRNKSETPGKARFFLELGASHPGGRHALGMLDLQAMTGLPRNPVAGSLTILRW